MPVHASAGFDNEKEEETQRKKVVAATQSFNSEGEEKWKKYLPLGSTKQDKPNHTQDSSTNKDEEVKRASDKKRAAYIARLKRYNKGLRPLPGEPPLTEEEKRAAGELQEMIDEMMNRELYKLFEEVSGYDTERCFKVVITDIE